MDQQARNLACTQSQYCMSTVKGYRRFNLPHLECDSFHSTEGAIGHYQKVAFASMRPIRTDRRNSRVGGGRGEPLRRSQGGEISPSPAIFRTQFPSIA